MFYETVTAIAASYTLRSYVSARAKMPDKVTTLDTAHVALSFPNAVFALVALSAFILNFAVYAATTFQSCTTGFHCTMGTRFTYFALARQFKVFAPTAFGAVDYLTTMRTLVGVKCNVLDQFAKLIVQSSLILHLDLCSLLRCLPPDVQQE